MASGFPDLRRQPLLPQGIPLQIFAMSAILADGDNPTLIELERFKEAVDEVDLTVSFG